MQKVRQNDLKFSANQFFVFELLIYFFVNVSSNFVIQERLDLLSNRGFQKDIYLQFFMKVPQLTARLSKKQNCRNFDVFGECAQIQTKINWLGFGIHTI